MSKPDERQNLQRAFDLHQSGKIGQAAHIYRRILRSDPDNVQALHYLGVAEATDGNFERAKHLMRRSLKIQPINQQFIENYATTLYQTGDYESAREVCEHGLRINNKSISCLYICALALFKMRRLQDSIAHFDSLLLFQPNHIAALNERGSVFAEMKKYDAALASVQRALAIAPQYAEAHLNSGNLYCGSKRFEEAIVAYDTALTLKPELADAWLGRGNVLRILKRYDDSLAAYEKALALKPDLPGAWLGRGNLAQQLKKHHEALALYDRALATQPGFAEAWLGRGNIFFELKQFDDASSAYARALTLKPELAEAWLGQGNVFFELKKFDDALGAYARALALQPDLAEGWLGRGNVFFELKHFEDAFRAYDGAVALEPHLAYAAGLRLQSKLNLCDWTNLEAEVAQLLSGLREGKVLISPFTLIAVPSSPTDQLLCARRHIEDKLDAPPNRHGALYSHDRIRVAYLSADFHEHATAYLTAGLFEQHDKSRFDVTGISFGPDQNSPMRQRISGAFERFVDVQHKSDQQIADLIRGLEIDIAVDLKGFTKDGRPNVLARRPAPIQANYLGYPGTMGAAHIDYIIADPTVIPEMHFEFYSEKVVWLPDSYQVNDNRRRISERNPTRRECGLPDKGFVFCCFNDAYKITASVFDIWMRLLRETKDSVLWLLEGNSLASKNLRDEAEKRGISSRRLIFAGRASLADHLARHRQANLFLDTLPCNAHTTASDALWAGLPVVTCVGATFAGRVAASLLKATGLDELITPSLEDYEALALKLASDPELLGSFKARLERNRDGCALFDTVRSTRHIEAAYLTMQQRLQRGLTPESFAVESND